MKALFGCDPKNRKLTKIFIYFFLISILLILSTQIIAKPKKENSIPHYQKFPATNIDISTENKNISDKSEAIEYLNHFVKQRLNFSDQEIFKISQENQLAKGYKSYRFQHFYKDIQVEFNDLILSVNQDGKAEHIWGYAWPVEDIDIVANLTAEVATKKALKSEYPDIKLDSIEVLKDYGLVIWLRDNKSAYLAYKSDLHFEHGNEVAMLRIYADADTGLLLETLPLIRHALKRVIFETPNNCTAAPLRSFDFQICENASETNSQSRQYLRRCEGQPSVSIPKVDNLYDGLGKIYRFLEAQGYDSIDRRGYPLIAGIFDQTCRPNAEYYSFGFSNRPHSRVGFHPRYTNDLAVIGHELMHGVVTYSSGLVYSKESGALDESLADIFGVTAKFWIENNGFNGQPSAADYLFSNARNMSNPKQSRSGSQPDYYLEAKHLDDIECRGGPRGNNWCGVHKNCGIINLAFYLLAEGGKHPRQKTSIQVPGIGIEKAFNIFFEGQKNFSRRTDFGEARRRLATRAKILYDADAKHSVNLAFDAVGVADPESPQITPPKKETPPPEEGEVPDNVTLAEKEETSDNAPPIEKEEAPDNVTPIGKEETSDNAPPIGKEETSDNVTLAEKEETSDNVTLAEKEETSDNAPPTEKEETSDNAPPVGKEEISDNAPPTEKEETSDNAPPVGKEEISDNVILAEKDTSENNHLFLILLVLSLLLLFFVLNIRKNKTSTSKEKDVSGDSLQSTEKTWMLSNHKTNQSISLSASKLMLPDGIVVGRLPQFCHSTFPDRHLSSRHARFSMHNSNLSIEDLNTTNGTYVNGVRIKPFKVVKLEAGNEVKLARCRFSVDYK